MKIVLSEAAGGPETLVLREVDAPVAGPGQVLVAVRACSVNFPDALMIADRYQFKPPRPFAPGLEAAGVIEALGEGVEGLAIGDRVIAMLSHGGMAEKIAVPAAGCTPMPDAMSFEHGASFIATFGTAYHALAQRGRVQPGETLLVLGAGGGMGLASVALGKALGARVIAAASSQAKIDLAISLGAQVGVVYPAAVADLEGRKALAGLFKAAGGAAGFDVICDNVGGDYAEAALRSIAWGGRFLVVGFPAGIPSIPLNLPLLKGCDIVGVLYGAYAQRNPADNRDNIGALMDLYVAGAIAPHVSASYPLEQAGLAVAELSNRQALGKIVVRPSAG
jgi:NADPH2:quinone reductase